LLADIVAKGDDWTTFQVRPGALFLVGDPKQAIYRFRGADVAAYIQAREAFLAQAPDSVVAISTNFRSCQPILRYVNDHFKLPLSTENGQPGFTALDAFHPNKMRGCAWRPSTLPWPMPTAKPRPNASATAKPRLSPTCVRA
jgi:ATP-dependent exoDNAse (exonuclease V) beta subunit